MAKFKVLGIEPVKESTREDGSTVPNTRVNFVGEGILGALDMNLTNRASLIFYGKSVEQVQTAFPKDAVIEGEIVPVRAKVKEGQEQYANRMVLRVGNEPLEKSASRYGITLDTTAVGTVDMATATATMSDVED